MRPKIALRRFFNKFEGLPAFGKTSDLNINVEPDKFIIQKLDNVKLIMFEGDIDRMAEVLALKSTVDFVEFKENKKLFATSAQFLDKQYGTVDSDFIVIKPPMFVDGSIRPRTDQWIVEASKTQSNEVCSAIKHFSKKKRSLQMFNLENEVHSYRIFKLEIHYSNTKPMAGKLNKAFYPPKELRVNTTPEDFLDLCVYHPKTHELWFNLYSANPFLQKEMTDLAPAKGWEYQANRYYSKVPEFDECTDLLLDRVWGGKVPVNKNNYPGKGLSEGRSGFVTIAYADTVNWEASGKCVGIASHMVKKDIKIPAGTHFEDKNGQRLLSVIASVNNVCLVFVDSSCSQRIFKMGTDNDIYLHVFEKGY